VALQLTNILRDVAVDYRRDRFYLPLDDLSKFGCSEEDVKREVEQAGPGRSETPKVKALLEHQAARARIFFSRAVRVLPKDDARRFVAAEIMRVIYFDLSRRSKERDSTCSRA
jgi:phytoene synthase